MGRPRRPSRHGQTAAVCGQCGGVIDACTGRSGWRRRCERWLPSPSRRALRRAARSTWPSTASTAADSAATPTARRATARTRRPSPEAHPYTAAEPVAGGRAATVTPAAAMPLAAPPPGGGRQDRRHLWQRHATGGGQLRGRRWRARGGAARRAGARARRGTNSRASGSIRRVATANDRGRGGRPGGPLEGIQPHARPACGGRVYLVHDPGDHRRVVAVGAAGAVGGRPCLPLPPTAPPLQPPRPPPLPPPRGRRVCTRVAARPGGVRAGPLTASYSGA